MFGSGSLTIRVRFCSGSGYFKKIRFVFGSSSSSSLMELEMCFCGGHLLRVQFGFLHIFYSWVRLGFLQNLGSFLLDSGSFLSLIDILLCCLRVQC